MTSPAGDRRERLVALLVAGVAVVLLVSSPTWFASDPTGVGIAQLFLGVVLAAVAGLLYRRAQRRCPPRPGAGPGRGLTHRDHRRRLAHRTGSVSGPSAT